MYFMGETEAIMRNDLQWGAAFAANGLIYANDLADAAMSALSFLYGVF